MGPTDIGTDIGAGGSEVQLGKRDFLDEQQVAEGGSYEKVCTTIIQKHLSD